MKSIVRVSAEPGLDAVPAPVLECVEASLSGPRGVVFGPITARSDKPITVVHGRRGSGRTSFLLGAAGRMRLSSGTVALRGTDSGARAGHVRRIAGLAGFDAIDALEPTARVAEAMRERLTWTSPWYTRVPRLTAGDVEMLLASVFGPLEQPHHDALIRDLSEANEMLLRIALALLECPTVVMVDDLDDVKDPTERALVAARMEELTRDGIAFVVGSADDRDLDLFSPHSSAVIALDR